MVLFIISLPKTLNETEGGSKKPVSRVPMMPHRSNFSP